MNKSLFGNVLELLTMTFLLYVFLGIYIFGNIPLFSSALGALIAVNCFMYYVASRMNAKLPNSIVLLLIYILLSFFTGVFCARDYNAVISASANMLEYLLVGFSLFLLYTDGEKRKKRTLWTLSLIPVLTTVAMFLWGSPSARGQLQLGDLNMNTYSSIVMLGLCALVLIMVEGSREDRIIAAVCACVLYIGGFFAASRRFLLVSILLLGISMLFYCIPRALKRNYRLAVLGIIIGVLVFILFINHLIYLILSQTVLGQRFEVSGYEGDQERLFFYYLAWNLFISHPLIGVGLGNFELYNPYDLYSHSLFAEVSSCCGLLGILCLSASFFALFFEARRSLSPHRLRILFCLVLTILINGIFTVTIYELMFYCEFCLLSAYSCGACISGQRSEER